MNESDVQSMFWDEYSDIFQGDYALWQEGTSQNGLTCDCRCTWVDFVDSLARSGIINETLASEVTL